MNTLLLNGGWDLCIDDNGNIAVATGAYAIAQDVASAVKTFLGEVWYNASLGVPYLQQILGQKPSIQFIKQQFINAGLVVPGILPGGTIQCFLTGPGVNREIGGQLQILNSAGAIIAYTGSPAFQAGVAPWYVSAVSPEASA